MLASPLLVEAPLGMAALAGATAPTGLAAEAGATAAPLGMAAQAGLSAVPARMAAQAGLGAAPAGLGAIGPSLQAPQAGHNGFLGAIVQCLWRCADFRRLVGRGRLGRAVPITLHAVAWYCLT